MLSLGKLNAPSAVPAGMLTDGMSIAGMLKVGRKDAPSNVPAGIEIGGTSILGMLKAGKSNAGIAMPGISSGGSVMSGVVIRKCTLPWFTPR